MSQSRYEQLQIYNKYLSNSQMYQQNNNHFPAAVPKQYEPQISHNKNYKPSSLYEPNYQKFVHKR